MSNTDPNRPGGTHGSSTVTPVDKKKGFNWLPWLLALLGLLLLLFTLSQCSKEDRSEPATTTEQTTTTTTTDTSGASMADPNMAGAAGAGAAGVASTAGTGAAAVDIPGNSTPVSTGLQPYLAGAEPTPRRFTFERLNFATGSATLPADASQTIGAVAQILTASTTSAVRIEGYADARGSEPANQKLGADRANAVAQAMIAAGVPANRVTAVSGGESNPVDSNATASGQAENRRTDLVVTAR